MEPNLQEVLNDRPLSGVRVVEFSHMVMGPSVGAILADLGADVIKVEPVGGDRTRRLLGSGSGYFAMFNRNKRSICLDLKSEAGLGAAKDLLSKADVVVENFRPGALEKLGLGAEAVRAVNPKAIYYSAKGFLTGPYENRAALDEVAQMMGGLAYMTGPSGRPLRAGASVIDITGGMFGVIGIIAALFRREQSGEGGVVRSSLYETTAYMVGQHIAQLHETGQAARPMPERVSAWAVYDVFETAAAEEQIFIGVVSDSQWESFVQHFDLGEIGANPAYAKNNDRVLARDVILPALRALVKQMSRDDALVKCETAGVAFAPIARPQDLLDDAHLNSNGALIDLTLTNGKKIKLPATPVEIDGALPDVQRDIPHIGQDTRNILAECGYSSEKIDQLLQSGAAEWTDNAAVNAKIS